MLVEVVVVELKSQFVFKLKAYFRKIWLALKRAVRFSFLEFSIRGDSVPRLFGRSCPSTSWNACTLAMEWQTPWPPPDASPHRPSPLTYVVLPTVHLFALPLTLLTPPGLPSQKNIRPWPISSPPGSSGLLPLHLAQWNSWWMTDYWDTPCIYVIFFILDADDQVMSMCDMNTAHLIK